MKTAEEIIDKYFSYNEFDKKRVVEAMQEYAEQFASQDKWISVEEKPKEEGVYLIFYSNQFYMVAHFDRDKWTDIEDNHVYLSHYQYLTPPKTK